MKTHIPAIGDTVIYWSWTHDLPKHARIEGIVTAIYTDDDSGMVACDLSLPNGEDLAAVPNGLMQGAWCTLRENLDRKLLEARAVTPAERLRYHAKAYAPVMRDLEEAIERNMRLARMNPRMRWYYVKVVRLQNRMLLSNRRALRDMAQGGELPPRPQRPPHVPTRPGETGYAANPPSLTALGVALREPTRDRQAPVTTPWPTGNAAQLSMFGGSNE